MSEVFEYEFYCGANWIFSQEYFDPVYRQETTQQQYTATIKFQYTYDGDLNPRDLFICQQANMTDRLNKDYERFIFFTIRQGENVNILNYDGSTMTYTVHEEGQAPVTTTYHDESAINRVRSLQPIMYESYSPQQGQGYKAKTLYISNLTIMNDQTEPWTYKGYAYKNGTYYNTPLNLDDPYADSTSEDDGGNGTPDWSDDPIDFAPLPPNYFGDSGLVSIFTPTTSELNALANYMWSDNGLDLNDFKKIVNNPFDLILGLSYIPLKVNIAGQRGVNVGNILAVDTGLTMSYPTSESYEHDFGSIVLNEEEQAFIDYAPYSKVSIYLPFIGMQSIDIDLLRKNKKYNNISAMKVMYRYNIVTGAICATLYTVRDGMNKPYYTWIGSVGDSIPVASNDYSQSMIALSNMASNAVMGGIAGGSVGGAIGAVAGVATSALSGVGDTVSTLKPTINTNGAIGGSCAPINSVRQCYLIVEQPPLSIPNNYGFYVGYPRNISDEISNSRGFNVIQSMRLGTETDCMTDSERDELQQILTSGYIYGNKKGIDPSPSIPSSNDMSVALYQTESSAIRIDKKCTLLHNYFNCVCKDNTSVVTPTIKLKVEGTSNILSANYAYIPKFKRFYFIRDIRNVAQDLWEIDLKCDVLMSFKNDFIHNNAIFKRSEYNYNLYLNDGSIQLDSRSRIHLKKFPNDIDNSGTYVLIMAGKT